MNPNSRFLFTSGFQKKSPETAALHAANSGLDFVRYPLGTLSDHLTSVSVARRNFHCQAGLGLGSRNLKDQQLLFIL
jgi:hypothetical protein